MLSDSGKVNVASDQHAALWILSITYTWMTLVSVVGLVGISQQALELVGLILYTDLLVQSVVSSHASLSTRTPLQSKLL